MRIGTLTVGRTLRANRIYRWVEATDASGREVELQILSGDITRMKANATGDYFESLLDLQHPLLITPVEIVPDDEAPLVVCYPHYRSMPLGDALVAAPQQFPKWSRQASEALGYLHERGLQHGCISPESFVVVNDDVMLTNFGYARLLGMGHPDALELYSEYIAPETRQQALVRPESDLYGYAKTMVAVWPKLEGTAWFRRAAANKPDARFATARETYAEMEKVFPSVGILARAKAFREVLDDDADTGTSLPEPVEDTRENDTSVPEPLEAEAVEDGHSLPEPTEPESQEPDSGPDLEPKEGEEEERPQEVHPPDNTVRDSIPWRQSSERDSARTLAVFVLVAVVVLGLVAFMVTMFLNRK